jgi:hypothetical protein
MLKKLSFILTAELNGRACLKVPNYFPKVNSQIEEEIELDHLSLVFDD